MDLKFVISSQNKYVILSLAKLCYFGKRVGLQKMYKSYCIVKGHNIYLCIFMMQLHNIY